ncbi:predicted protein [Sclerotinia sclerotiorum 1980 UF-70]|uniref:Uncharacterized protein n=1 Tax=Sclerotinia sclerotiorum (strain ATCC 18683 / 1980 / Ss-1) TaxID=665079 RepID=A7EF44_SCLS1|nr:predicted protein [Sclerotinia sclerotiorum 1980 UF-70]EDO01460.1 predicted protein [Sclerotinia sclerotiorum 1980 UF-70]
MSCHHDGETELVSTRDIMTWRITMFPQSRIPDLENTIFRRQSNLEKIQLSCALETTGIVQRFLTSQILQSPNDRSIAIEIYLTPAGKIED